MITETDPTEAPITEAEALTILRDLPTSAPALEALAWHVAGVCRRYGLTAEDVAGHREAPYATDCPGDRLDLDALRERIRQLLPNPALYG